MEQLKLNCLKEEKSKHPGRLKYPIDLNKIAEFVLILRQKANKKAR